jgi:hypothetical protein
MSTKIEIDHAGRMVLPNQLGGTPSTGHWVGGLGRAAWSDSGTPFSSCSVLPEARLLIPARSSSPGHPHPVINDGLLLIVPADLEGGPTRSDKLLNLVLNQVQVQGERDHHNLGLSEFSPEQDER